MYLCLTTVCNAKVIMMIPDIRSRSLQNPNDAAIFFDFKLIQVIGCINNNYSQVPIRESKYTKIQFSWEFAKFCLAKISKYTVYNFVEPSSFVHKLLPRRVCDGHETRPYYRAPHGECHKGVGGKRFVTAEKSAARIPTLTKIDIMY